MTKFTKEFIIFDRSQGLSGHIGLVPNSEGCQKFEEGFEFDENDYWNPDAEIGFEVSDPDNPMYNLKGNFKLVACLIIPESAIRK